jgi:hypothetical protein
MLSKKERKARHLAAAAYLTTAWADEQEIVEVVASHYLDAYRLLPEAEDAPTIKRQAREALTRAGERAASLAATVEAARVFSAAAELADEPLDQAALYARAGRAAYSGGAFLDARRDLERSHELYEQEGAGRDAALTLALLGNTDWQLHDSDRAVERLERAFSVLAAGEQDEGLAAVAAELARVNFFRGELEAAEKRVTLAVDVAERLWLPEWLSQALNTAGLIAIELGRWEYGYALTERALRLALDNDLPAAALRAYTNLCNHLDEHDRYEEDIELASSALALARKVGARSSEWRIAGELAAALHRTGQWDEADELLAALPEEALPYGAGVAVACSLAVGRGRVDDARSLLTIVERDLDRADVQDVLGYLTMKAQILNAEGAHAEALSNSSEAIERGGRIGAALKLCYVEALTAAHALRDEDALRAVLARIEEIPRGMLPPTLSAHAMRFRARLGEEPEQRFRNAAALLREYQLAPEAALVQLDHAEWLVEEGRTEESAALLAEVREVFAQLGATPWLERADALLPAGAEAVA